MVTFPATFWSEPPVGGGGGGSYVNSVQHVTITIPVNVTSATATISAVGSYAFILHDGFLATSSSNSSISFVRLELTDSTTVTAYRNSSSATQTTTVRCVVVDATSSLLASVQFGTVSIAASSTSGTATISSTNSSYTAIHLLGINSSQTSLSYTGIEAVLSVSGTTVTATRLAASINTLDVEFVVLEFQSAACNQTIQSYQKSWTNSSTSTTQSITSVDVDNTILIYAGSNGNSTGNAANTQQQAVLTDGTTVTISTNSAGSISCQYNFFVVEFASGVLNSAVQRGTTTLTAVSSNTSTISSVDTSKSIINLLHFTASQTSSNISNVQPHAALTNATTVTVARNGSTNNVTASWEVAEFT
jgi:hypothetical protein